jgi:diguanylate cyclase (GGDEF)-like protein/PAS domain S-box-containing protein
VAAVKRCLPPVLALATLALVLLTGLHAPLRNALTDLRFSQTSRDASGRTVFVAIDSQSIDAIGVWPWPRQLHAQLLDQLHKAGAGTTAFDVDFSSPSTPEGDQAFAAALKRFGGSAVLAAFEQRVAQDTQTALHLTWPLKAFADQAWIGLVNVAPGKDGLVREYPYGQSIDGRFVPSLGALLAGRYETKKGPLTIDYGLKPASVPMVSYIDVLRGKPDALQKLKGKNVIVGAQAIELGDRFNVPNGNVIPGALLQVLAAESIVQGRAMSLPSPLLSGALVALLLLLVTALWRPLSAAGRVILLLGLSATAEFAALTVQAKYPIVLDTSLIHAAIFAYLVAVALEEINLRALLSLIAERRFQRIAMSLGEGLVCADGSGRISFWNTGAEKIFGYAPGEIVGKPIAILYNRPRAETPSASPAQLPASGGGLVELEGVRKDGSVFPLEACFSEWQALDGSHYGATMRDISERKREAERILYLAEHDTLTGLANRNKLHQRIRELLDAVEPSPAALLMLDLDKFKQINDTLGHACGDEVLRRVAGHLTGICGEDTLIGRLGGDEFAIVVGGNDAAARAKDLSDRICTSFSQFIFPVGSRQLRVEVSVGIALYPEHCVSADDLLGNADLALYEAKARGRGGYILFEQSFRSKLQDRLSLETELLRAVINQEFELFYQPQVTLGTGGLVGAEALIRWRHPQRGLILPDQFMPVVNASSISDQICLWALRSACRQGRHWEAHGYPLRIGVNLAPSQFLTDDLPGIVAGVLQETGLSPHLLELEVTENILLDDDTRALAIFQQIQELGVHVAFDDFGTGYASLTYLKKFPLDRLKIDKSFIMKMTSNSDDMAIVGATLAMAHLLGLSVIAEGVEDAETAELLAHKGCSEGQGYLFGRPIPAGDFERRFLSDAPAEMPAPHTVAA